MTAPGASHEQGTPRQGDGARGDRNGRTACAAADGQTARPPAGSGWVATGVLRELVARFRESAASLPDRVWRRWARALAAGTAITIAVVVGLVHSGRYLADNGAFDWEPSFLRALDASFPVSFSVAIWLQTLGTDITLALVVAFAASIAAWDRRPLHALSIVIAFVGADLIVRFAWMLWDRPRPDLILDGAAAPGFASFPSGHMTESTAVYGLLAFLWARSSASTAERATAAALAATTILLVGLGRMRIGAHWPTDILAGALVGSVWLATLVTALSRAEQAAES